MPNWGLNNPGYPTDRAPCYQQPVFIEQGEKKLIPALKKYLSKLQDIVNLVVVLPLVGEPSYRWC